MTLREARIQAHLTQERAAARFGVSRYTLILWESGRRYPDALELKEIEVVYGSPFSDLEFSPRSAQSKKHRR